MVDTKISALTAGTPLAADTFPFQRGGTANFSSTQGVMAQSMTNPIGTALAAGTLLMSYVAPSTSGNVLTSNGTIWTSAAQTAASSSAEIITGTVNNKYIAPSTLLGALGFSGRFTSGNQTITSGGALTIAHGLGREPIFVTMWLKCLTAEYNYSIGDKLFAPTTISDSATDNHCHSIVVNSTNIIIRFGANANVYSVLDKTTGGGVALTNANWALVVEALG